MATEIQQEMSEQSARVAAAKTPSPPHLPPANSTLPLDPRAPGIDPLDFVRDNRIQVKDGSLFIGPYLVLHPRELAPANEAALRKKLQLTFSINNPTFFEDPARAAIAANLGQLIPSSISAEGSALLDKIKEHNARVDSGLDTTLQQELTDKYHPFAAIIREAMENPKPNPVETDLLKNSLAMYLLVREKLTQQGYLGKLTGYVKRTNTPDQVLSDLNDKLGVTPLQVREAALKNGLDGVGALLGLDPHYIADVKKLADYASTQDFSYNLVEHWHLGRQLFGINAPMQQKITTGLDARITAKMDEYRTLAHHHYDVPAPINQEELRIAQALNLVEPIQRAVMHKLGYEICFTPEITADDIAFNKGIYGLHRKAANDMRDIRGTYRVYFSGKGDLKGSMRTLVHEIAHNLWPAQFSAPEVAQMDQLADSDAERFTRLKRVMDEKFPEFERFVNACKAGNDQEKTAVIAAAKNYFAPYGVSIDEGLLPYLRDANDFRFLVQHAFDTLRVEGRRYNNSGYDSTPERFREVIARFAELKQVEYRSEPQLLHYLAPGLDQMFEAHYLPHLGRVYQTILASENPAYAAQHALQQTHHKNADFVGAPAPANDGIAPVANIPLPVAGGSTDMPKVKEELKVKQQPQITDPVNMPAHATPANDTGTPVKPAVAACMADDVNLIPSSMVDAGSILQQGFTVSHPANGEFIDRVGA